MTMVASALQALVHTAVTQPKMVDGVAWPSPQYLYAGQSLQQQTVVSVLTCLRRLAGGSFITMPSSLRSFASAETREDIDRYFRAGSVSAEERVKLLALIWDSLGTEFAGRQLQYEMFYSASQQVVDLRTFAHFDWTTARGLVDRCLGQY
jgi:4-hydroxyphenylacetate 3-monooxygenase